MGPRRKPQHSPQAHIWLDNTHPDPLLNRSYATLRDANNHYNDPFLSVWGPFGATQDSDTKTLWSLLLHYLQLRSTILAIRGSKSFSRSKHYNAPISMWVVMDSDRYLCMVITTAPTLKRVKLKILWVNKTNIHNNKMLLDYWALKGMEYL